MTTKKFKIPGALIRPLAPGHGWCFASDRIPVDGCRVGYMVRMLPEDEHDKGWQFFAGDESQDYCGQADNFAVYDVNTICNYDHSIIPLLRMAPPAAFARDEVTGEWRRDLDPLGED